jgi:prolyl 3-hydroxylase /prolyl 3,4-dihydroxylase
VRDEIRDSISFTPKETDIYKIHQSGDLANLDGLDNNALSRLPSLLTLRDNLYSTEFRRCVSRITEAGPLSGRKTDMAVNVYTPGCHLLCHDDVIGSRRVSYILYLTDPDLPWQSEWGGALRLYPTEEKKSTDGAMMRIPSAEFSVTIPPAFNQLSFFTVQPGESFHDVEEVYKRTTGIDQDDGGRVRMAISGWYHIPQEGEDGYEEGLEEKLAERSSLSQLQGRADEFDLPQPRWLDYSSDGSGEGTEVDMLSEEELSFLLKYMTPNYLTPDTVEELSDRFADESSVQLSGILSKTFSEKLRAELLPQDTETLQRAPKGSKVARPPHKHRYVFWERGKGSPSGSHKELLDVFLPSLAFKKWLQLITGGPTLSRCNLLARRFRRGSDYTLATGYNEAEPRLELCLNISPSRGWDDDDSESRDKVQTNGNSMNDASKPPDSDPVGDQDNVGGYEVYMVGEDDEESHDVTAEASTMTGAGKRRKADPAIYRAAGDDDEDEGVLFSNPASWNNMSIVLRDKGVLRFVKYVSQSAPGDRWDIVGEFDISSWPDDDDEE